MTESAAPAQTQAWTKTIKTVQATLFPSGPKLRPSLDPDTIAFIEDEALTMSRIALIGLAPTKHPLRIELQEWLNVNLVEPAMVVTRIWMLTYGYFVLTFKGAEGATTALQQSPLHFGKYLIYLHPWRSQFDLEAPKRIRIPLWIQFLRLDDFCYQALLAVCSKIGEVVWASKQEDYLRKSCTPQICILVADVKNIPSSIILLIPRMAEEIEIFLEYEGIPK